MSLLAVLGLLIGLLVFGVLVGWLTSFAIVPPSIRLAIRIAAACVVVYILLRVFGVLDAMARIHV